MEWQLEDVGEIVKMTKVCFGTRRVNGNVPQGGFKGGCQEEINHLTRSCDVWPDIMYIP